MYMRSPSDDYCHIMSLLHQNICMCCRVYCACLLLHCYVDCCFGATLDISFINVLCQCQIIFVGVFEVSMPPHTFSVLPVICIIIFVLSLYAYT
jgi:hypothetical protein